MDPLKERLNNALSRKEEVSRNLQRIQGRLDNARRNLEEVNEECRRRKVDPERLTEAIDKLTERYEEEVAKLETEIERAERELAPYLQEER